jgi:hypothetical protein
LFAPSLASPTAYVAAVSVPVRAEGIDHPTTTAAFAALAAIIAQVPAARRVMVFMFFILSVLSIV